MRVDQILAVIDNAEKPRLAKRLFVHLNNNVDFINSSLREVLIELDKQRKISLSKNDLKFLVNHLERDYLSIAMRLAELETSGKLTNALLKTKLLDNPEIFRAMNACAAKVRVRLIPRRVLCDVESWVASLSDYSVDTTSLGDCILARQTADAILLYNEFSEFSSVCEFLGIKSSTPRKEMETPREESQPKRQRTTSVERDTPSSSRNALEELARLLGKKELQLRTVLNGKKIKRIFSKHFSGVIDESFSAVDLLKSLSSIWAKLFKLLIETTEKTHNRSYLDRELKLIIEDLLNNCNVAELLCWSGKSSKERADYVQENFFTFIELEEFLEKVGERPETASNIDPEHLRALYQEFFAELEHSPSLTSGDCLIEESFKRVIRESRLELVTEFMEKSEKAAPLKALAQNFNSEKQKKKKSVEAPSLVDATAPTKTIDTCLDEMKAVCQISEESRAKLKEVVKTWVDHNLASHSDKATFTESLKEALGSSPEDSSKKALSTALLLSKVIEGGLIKFQ